MSDKNNATADASLLIDIKELSKLLDISPRSIWRLLSEGKVISPVRIGGSVKWRRDELTQWIANGCPEPQLSRRLK